MTIEEMKQLKKERGYSYAQMAELSGVPLGTIQKIFSGETESPRYDSSGFCGGSHISLHKEKGLFKKAS